MATKKPARKPRKVARKKKEEGVPLISPDMRRHMWAIILIVLALLTALGCINSGGSWVTGAFHGLRVALGYAAYMLPIVFAVIAWMLFFPERYRLKALNYIGFIGFVLTMASLFHVGIKDDALAQAQAGNGGGYA